METTLAHIVPEFTANILLPAVMFKKVAPSEKNLESYKMYNIFKVSNWSGILLLFI